MSKPAVLCVDDEMVVLNILKIQRKKEFGDAYTKELISTIKSGLEKL